MKTPRYIEKTDGQGNTYSVLNPDCYTDEGYFVKRRYKPTNLTPKKKKRK